MVFLIESDEKVIIQLSDLHFDDTTDIETQYSLFAED
jgi:hypothetical protein